MNRPTTTIQQNIHFGCVKTFHIQGCHPTKHHPAKKGRSTAKPMSSFDHFEWNLDQTASEVWMLSYINIHDAVRQFLLGGGARIQKTKSWHDRKNMYNFINIIYCTDIYCILNIKIIKYNISIYIYIIIYHIEIRHCPKIIRKTWWHNFLDFPHGIFAGDRT